MKKIGSLILILIIVSITGCQSKEESQVNQEIQLLIERTVELESTIEELNEKVKGLEIENKSLEESLTFSNDLISSLPYYVERCLGSDSLKCMLTQTPDDSFLLFKTQKKVAGFTVFEYEQGYCFGHADIVVYSTESTDYIYSVAFGCNPEWITPVEPLFLLIDGSLLTISDAIDQSKITVDDLNDSYYIEKRSR